VNFGTAKQQEEPDQSYGKHQKVCKRRCLFLVHTKKAQPFKAVKKQTNAALDPTSNGLSLLWDVNAARLMTFCASDLKQDRP
jgi:hypothetical protein